MKIRKGSAWMFAFSDLAFLLLISLSLVPSAPDDVTLRFVEMNLPVVPDSETMQPVASAGEVWELQILPVTNEQPLPFRLTRAGAKQGKALDEATLIPALEELHQRQILPVLLPEKTSISQDFLYAAAALNKVWSNQQARTVVSPLDQGETQ